MKKLSFGWFEENFEGILMVLFLVLLTVLVLAQIVMRYVFVNPMTWSEELCRTLFVWSGFLSIGYCVRKGTTICLDTVRNLFPPAIRRLFLCTSSLIMIVLLSYLLYGSIQLVESMAKRGTLMAGMQIPMLWLYAVPMIGIGIGILRFIQVLIMTKFFSQDHNSQKED